METERVSTRQGDSIIVSRAGQDTAGTGAAPTTLTEPVVIRRGLIGLALTYLGLFLVVPLLAVFVKALEHGMTVYWSAILVIRSRWQPFGSPC
jgi:hypothetical protein